jgi:two-component system LytT family response regulator
LLYLEAQANYTRFVCPDRAVLSLVTLKQLEETLPPEFMRVHRSYIVNTRLIQLIEGATIKIGDRKVPVGETYRQEVLKRFAPLTDDR